ncbi:unnamed protein product [Heligmosomoides polygyrus]|uniref:DDE_3 domain-containing protein n=1 Tax=Heligmosomoides polygyrus TaxID=6339 RepID=A0A183G6B4_HELPZ|nr:unnamed protein product [Heligmosomoides polygyrus]
MQDNAPAHKSGYITTRLAAWNASVMDWPPESPDLNPIELFWENLKTFKAGLRTLDGLREAVEKYWCALIPEICKRYIDGIAEKMRRVVEQEGRNIYEGH